MSKLRPPAFHDIARVIGRDIDETEARLYAYYTDPAAAFFSYRRARSLCRYAFGGMVPLAHLLAGCDDEHTRQGQNSNREVLRLLWNMAAHRTVQTYELAPRSLAIRKDLSIRVAPPFYFVEGTTAYVFWLQPRKNYALDLAALNLLSSIVKATFLVDDFRDVGFEVCDMSAPALGRDRNPTVYHLESFNILAEAEMRAKLQLFALAYDRLVARGVERSQRTLKQRPQPGPDLISE